jgi:hypothetical protein
MHGVKRETVRCASINASQLLDPAIATTVSSWQVKGFGGTLLTWMDYFFSVDNSDMATIDILELIRISMCMYRGNFLDSVPK